MSSIDLAPSKPSGSSRARRAPAQLAFAFRTWGGRRAGAGRPKKSAETVSHAARPRHSKHHPLHVTLRLLPGRPSLRGSRLFRRLRAAFRAARERFGFTLSHYSVQGNHLHLLVEANDRRALSRGVQGLAIRVARAVNRVHARRGRVFAERYHARALRTPLEVRRALVYVLFNERHHLAQRGLSLPPWWMDPCSSASEFSGFRPLPELPPPHLVPHHTTVPPRFYLLRTGWRRRHGPISLEETPAR
jgi:REP element-mobilizing transposase RayT